MDGGLTFIQICVDSSRTVLEHHMILVHIRRGNRGEGEGESERIDSNYVTAIYNKILNITDPSHC